MRYVGHSTDEYRSRCAGKFNMLAPLLIMSLMRSTVSSLFSSDMITDSKVTEVDGSRNLPEWMQHAQRLVDRKKQQNDQLDRMIPDSGSCYHASGSEKDPQNLLSGRLKRGSSDKGELWKKIDDWDKKKSQIPTSPELRSDKLEKMFEEWIIFKKDLDEFYAELAEYKPPTLWARDLFEEFQKVISNIGNKMEAWKKATSKKSSNDELQMQMSVDALSSVPEDFESVLIKYHEGEDHFDSTFLYLMKVKVFDTLNFLIKQEVLDLDVLKSWLNKEIVIQILMSHLFKLCYIPLPYERDIRESLSKSRSSQHLHIALHLLSGGAWKKINRWYFESQYEGSITSTYGQTGWDGRFREIYLLFNEKMFSEYNIESAIDTSSIKKIILFFGTHESMKMDYDYLNQRTFLYKMVYHVMKHHTETSFDVFRKAEDAQLFLNQMMAIYHSMEYLKSNYHLQYFASSHLSLFLIEKFKKMSKENPLTWRLAQKSSWLPKTPDRKFRDNFSLEITGDEKAWSNYLQIEFQEKENLSRPLFTLEKLEARHSERLWRIRSDQIPNEALINPMSSTGTNFFDKGLNSNTFTQNIYEWVDRLEFLLRQFKQDEEVYNKRLLELAKSNVRTSEWLKSSAHLESIRQYISKNCDWAKRCWQHIKAELEILNRKTASFEKSSTSDTLAAATNLHKMKIDRGEATLMTDEIGSSSGQVSQPHQSKGFRIPDLDFTPNFPSFD